VSMQHNFRPVPSFSTPKSKSNNATPQKLDLQSTKWQSTPNVCQSNTRRQSRTL
jgi:hypothetical protein